jgi:hypothetical protein
MRAGEEGDHLEGFTENLEGKALANSNIHTGNGPLRWSEIIVSLGISLRAFIPLLLSSIAS